MTNRPLVQCAALVLALSAYSTVAFGHAMMIEKDVQANTWHMVDIGISHGCEGSTTHTVSIKIPEGINIVRPERKPGWTMTMKMRKSDMPIQSEGMTYTETVDEVTWSGGNLGDLEFDRFSALIRFPNKPGQMYYFKTSQYCEKGESHWVEIPEGGKRWGEYSHPAPFVVLYDGKVAPAP